MAEEKNNRLAFFLFEGDAEDVFYKNVLYKYLNRKIPRKYKNLHGTSGINKEVAHNLEYFANNN